MKLHDLLTKLKNAGLKVADLRMTDMDRAGDLAIALMLSVALTGVTLAVLYGAGTVQGFPFLH